MTESKTKILMVDDKPENIFSLRSLIEAPDVEILSATSGLEALSLLLDHEFGLAILDVQMPQMSGLELAKLMRGAKRSRHVPIIFVTAARSENAAIFEGYEQGAVDFMLKPLNPHIVRSKVRVFIELDQQRKKLKEQLYEMERLKEEAEAANSAKSRFLANMSHEIRTPLGAVLGFAELMNDEDQSLEDRLQCIDAITRNGHLLLKLIDDILDFSKIEADRIEFEKLSFSLEELIDDVRSVFQHRAEQKGIRFSVSLGAHVPRKITSDPIRLKQILNNVIANAIKFTARGSVNVAVSFDPNTPTSLKFTVTDSGCGMTSDAAGRLFQPFMQADSTTTRKYGGTGLGLSISKRLAKMLGGDLVLVKAAPGAGSQFEITIDPGPLEGSSFIVERDDTTTTKAERVADALSGQADLSDVRVLVVDDARDNQKLVSSFLKMCGADVDCADNGIDAVSKAMASRYDVVLMDIQMPGVDGYEATAKLRESGYDRPIIACTAHAMKDELERCMKAGCDDHISKPIDRQSLIESVVKYTRSEPVVRH